MPIVLIIQYDLILISLSTQLLSISLSFPSHPVPSRLGPFPSVPYPGPDGTGRDEMGRECSDNQIITIIVQFFPAVTNDFLFHSPHVPVPLRHSPFVSRSVGSLMSFTSFPRPSGRDRRERNEGREEMEG